MSEGPSLIRIRRGAWDDDSELSLSVPSHWLVTELRLAPTRPLSAGEIHAALAAPAGGPPVRDLAAGKRHIGVIVDDLTRPTRADELLGPLLSDLAAAGVTREQLTLFVACGSHDAPSEGDIAMKVGSSLAGFGHVVVHDCHTQCEHVGTTRRGTPVSVNARLLTCDLRIGVGSVFPHPAAAFSGGAKLLAPGMCGAVTIRHMHDHLRPARERGGELACEFRDEMNEIVRMVGLDHVVLAVPGADRRAVACIAGTPEDALTRAVTSERQLATVLIPAPTHVDAIIIDAYPFDSTLQFAHDRALWPIKEFPPEVPAVVIARCQRGAGTHEFFPAANPFLERIWRRVRGIRTSDLRRIPEILRNAVALRAERRREIILMAEGLTGDEVRCVFPHGIVCRTWWEVCSMIDARLPGVTPRVALFSSAPLLLPQRQRPDPITS